MHSFDYDLGCDRKCVAHYDGDCTGRAIWTIVENNERVAEVEADIEDVQDMALLAMYDDDYNIIIDHVTFPLDAIDAILKSLVIDRISELLDDKLYDVSLHGLLGLEAEIGVL